MVQDLLARFQVDVDYQTIQAWFAAQVQSQRDDCHFSFALGWNAFPFRWKAAHLHASSLYRLLQAKGNDRYEEDHNLFCFFASAVSAIECAHYAANAVGAMIDPNSFPLLSDRDLRSISRKTVPDRFALAFPGSQVAIALQSSVGLNCPPSESALNDLLFEYRNVLTHRGTPPRTFYAGGPLDGQILIPANASSLPHDWVRSFEIKDRCLDDIRGHLDRSLVNITKSLARFLAARP